MLPKAADAGDPAALCNLGFSYQEGIGVTKDEVKAATYYQQAADAGLSYGLYNLGLCYKNGIGVPKDKIKAIKYYYLAVLKNNKRAQAALKSIYETSKRPFVQFLAIVAQLNQNDNQFFTANKTALFSLLCTSSNQSILFLNFPASFCAYGLLQLKAAFRPEEWKKAILNLHPLELQNLVEFIHNVACGLNFEEGKHEEALVLLEIVDQIYWDGEFFKISQTTEPPVLATITANEPYDMSALTELVKVLVEKINNEKNIATDVDTDGDEDKINVKDLCGKLIVYLNSKKTNILEKLTPPIEIPSQILELKKFPFTLKFLIKTTLTKLYQDEQLPFVIRSLALLGLNNEDATHQFFSDPLPLDPKDIHALSPKSFALSTLQLIRFKGWIFYINTLSYDKLTSLIHTLALAIIELKKDSDLSNIINISSLLTDIEKIRAPLKKSLIDAKLTMITFKFEELARTNSHAVAFAAVAGWYNTILNTLKHDPALAKDLAIYQYRKKSAELEQWENSNTAKPITHPLIKFNIYLTPAAEPTVNLEVIKSETEPRPIS